MPIQFLDMRVSEHGDDTLPNAPNSLLFGDIGLQTAGVLPENEDDIRVQLNGYVKIPADLVLNETLTIRVFREATEIFTTTYTQLVGVFQETWGFSAVDFPPLAPLDGEIQYTATIETSSGATSATIEDANFSGTAAAGTTT